MDWIRFNVFLTGTPSEPALSEVEWVPRMVLKPLRLLPLS